MKKTIIFQILLFVTLFLSAQPIEQHSMNAMRSNNKNQPKKPASDPNGEPMIEQHQKIRNEYPFHIYLTTMDKVTISGLAMEVNDSAIVISPDIRGPQKEGSPGSEIIYSHIREIKLKKKQGLLNGLGIGAGIGLLPVLGGSII